MLNFTTLHCFLLHSPYLPNPSVVVILNPSAEYKGKRHCKINKDSATTQIASVS